MTDPRRSLSAAELSALEHAFAAEPASDAYRPLAEGYLAAGRYMEAMVVCKKGVKAHPDDPSARVLLARIHAGQGKDRKALEELAEVLSNYPNYAAAHLLAGTLQLRAGATADGTASLRRAAEAAPNDPAVKEALARHGVVIAPAPPLPAARPAPPQAGVTPGSAPAAPAGERPAPTPAPHRPSGEAYAAALAEKYATHTWDLGPAGGRRRARATRLALAGSAILLVLLVAGLAGWAAFSRARRARLERIDRLLKETQELIGRDAYAAYREAAGRCAAILALDDASLAGHSYLAYVDAIRAGELGEGEAVQREGVAQVEAARRLGRHSHLLAAEAYLRASGGDAAGAVSSLTNLLETDPATQGPLLMGTLGTILVQTGDLDAAGDWLARAQKANPGDVRITSMLAEQLRRRGEGYELQADAVYQLALRLERTHVPSLLGRALLLVDRGRFEEATRHVDAALAVGEIAPRQRALALAIRGSLLFAAGQPGPGAAAEREALALDPQSPDLPWLVGRRQLRDGDAAGAVASIQRAVNGDPRRVAFYVDLTRALLATDGGGPRAVELLQKAAARVGDHPRIALLLGDAYRAEGDDDRAQGQYQRAIQLGKPYPDARVALARLLLQERNVPQALAELDLAISEYGAGSPGGAAQGFVAMADAERSRGARPALLRDLYAKALAKDPASCEALWGAGTVAPGAGRRPSGEARARLEDYLRICPRALHAAEARELVGAAP